MPDLKQIGRAAGIGRIDVPHLEAEIIDHRQPAETRRVAGGAEVPVDVVFRQAGIFERALGAFGVQHRHGLVLRQAGRVLVYPDDIGLSLDAHRGHTLHLRLTQTRMRWDTVRPPRSIPDCARLLSAGADGVPPRPPPLAWASPGKTGAI